MQNDYDALFATYEVTRPDFAGVVRQTLHDSALYPTAGQTQLRLFSTPIGQGITTALGGTAGAVKTENDTNMQMGSTLPNGMKFLAESIEILFLPGSVSTANTYTPATIAIFNATAALAVAAALNDVNTFYQSGRLVFRVLDKVYTDEQPLMLFPPKAMTDLSAAIASNSATTAEVGAVLAKAVGRPYYLEPKVTLLPAVNFSLTLNWPAAVATPSGFNGRVVGRFDGLLMRAVQS